MFIRRVQERDLHPKEDTLLLLPIVHSTCSPQNPKWKWAFATPSRRSLASGQEAVAGISWSTSVSKCSSLVYTYKSHLFISWPLGSFTFFLCRTGDVSNLLLSPQPPSLRKELMRYDFCENVTVNAWVKLALGKCGYASTHSLSGETVLVGGVDWK